MIYDLVKRSVATARAVFSGCTRRNTWSGQPQNAATRRFIPSNFAGFVAVLAAAITFWPVAAMAHTVTAGLTVNGQGSVTVYYGSYHLNVTAPEGIATLTGGPGGSITQTSPFSGLTSTKPSNLIDGVNNHHDDGTCVGGNSGAGSANGTPIVWQYATFSGLPAGTYSISLSQTTTANWDLCGGINPLTVTFDYILPSVAITGVPATTNAPFTATFNFSSDVTGFTAGGINVGNGTVSNLTAISPGVYTALITPSTNGPVTVDVPAGVAFSASSGNANTAAPQASSIYDTVPPTVAISGVPAATNAPFTTTFTYDKPVTGVTPTSFGVTNGTLSNLVAVSSTVYTATVTPTAPGTVTITAPAGGAQDLAGNSNTAATPASTTYDTTPPAVAISGVPATTNAPFTTTFTFSKPVTGVTVGTFGVANGTLSNFVAVSPTVYTATVTPTAPGTVTVTVPAGGANDAAGNSNTAATPATANYDTTPPTVAITGVPVTTNAPFTTTFTFSKPVTGVTVGTFGVANGTLSNFVAVSPTVYT